MGARNRRDEATVRFGVLADDGRQSSVWRLWIPPGKSDIYLAARSIAGKLKVSLHGSGAWREGFTKQFAEAPGAFPVPAGDRAREKWRRPPEFAPGLTMAYQVVIPESELWKPAEMANPGSVAWHSAPAVGQETVFSVILMRGHSVALSGWPGQKAMASSLVARYALTNGETCWFLAHDQPTLIENAATIERFKQIVEEGRAQVQLEAWSSIRGILLAVSPDGVRKSIEVKLSD